jgi:hypothetical protein
MPLVTASEAGRAQYVNCRFLRGLASCSLEIQRQLLKPRFNPPGTVDHTEGDIPVRDLECSAYALISKSRSDWDFRTKWVVNFI